MVDTKNNHPSPWYFRLTGNPDDYSPVADAYEYYMEQHEDASKEINALLKKTEKYDLENAGAKIPGIVGYRYSQLQEIEQILSFLENREKRMLGTQRRKYREHYSRELTDSMVEKFAETDLELLDLAEIRNMFALVRNKFLSLTKQLEYAHFQIISLTKLKIAGVDAAS